MGSSVVFHQSILSPHMVGLARALARRGHDVTYCATREMSEARASQGWQAPSTEPAKLHMLPNEASIDRFLDHCPEDAIHICQGIRGNDLIHRVQLGLRRRSIKHWVVMETIDDVGVKGLIKRQVYRRLLSNWVPHMHGILATGHRMPSWLEDRGFPKDQIFPFAYFLPGELGGCTSTTTTDRPFQITFVGRFIPLKRLDYLIQALEEVEGNFHLHVIGFGPQEERLRAEAERRIGVDRVSWIGRLRMEDTHRKIGSSDLLVLPSRYDGWGAVASEAMILGVPVLCSTACGVAGAVKASKEGATFDGGVAAMRAEIDRLIAQGPISEERRAALKVFSQRISTEAGAEYLEKILWQNAVERVPLAPWLATD